MANLSEAVGRSATSARRLRNIRQVADQYIFHSPSAVTVGDDGASRTYRNPGGSVVEIALDGRRRRKMHRVCQPRADYFQLSKTRS